MRHREPRSRPLIERAPTSPFALPGIVVALALIVALASATCPALYRTTALLLVAYAILSLPLAVVAARAALAQAPPVLEEVARSLGCRPIRATGAGHPAAHRCPASAPAAALVFLATVTELTATLLLAPIGTQTLATAVLGERRQPVLRRRRALRCSDGRDLRAAHLPADPAPRRRRAAADR